MSHFSASFDAGFWDIAPRSRPIFTVGAQLCYVGAFVALGVVPKLEAYDPRGLLKVVGHSSSTIETQRHVR